MLPAPKHAPHTGPPTREPNGVASIVLDVVHRLAEVVAAPVNAPKVQRVERDDPGRMVAITKTAA